MSGGSGGDLITADLLDPLQDSHDAECDQHPQQDAEHGHRPGAPPRRGGYGSRNSRLGLAGKGIFPGAHELQVGAQRGAVGVTLARVGIQHPIENAGESVGDTNASPEVWKQAVPREIVRVLVGEQENQRAPQGVHIRGG